MSHHPKYNLSKNELYHRHLGFIPEFQYRNEYVRVLSIDSNVEKIMRTLAIVLTNTKIHSMIRQRDPKSQQL